MGADELIIRRLQIRAVPPLLKTKIRPIQFNRRFFLLIDCINKQNVETGYIDKKGDKPFSFSKMLNPHALTLFVLSSQSPYEGQLTYFRYLLVLSENRGYKFFLYPAIKN